MVDNLSLVLQMLSLEILFRDFNNYDLMNELQMQDEKYLKKIIKQNEEIINLLKEVKNGKWINWKNRRKTKRDFR